MKRLILLLLLASAAGVQADTIGDVRATLLSLNARQPVRAAYEARRTNAARGRFYDNDFNSVASAEARVDDEGLAITYSRPVLDRARLEKTARLGANKPDVKTPRIADVSPLRIAELLDYGPSLAAMLERARIAEERQTLYRGQQARILVLELVQVRAEGVKEGRVKATGDRLTLWIGPDRLPLAAERTASFSAGILFIKGDGRVRETWSFAHHADRLVVTRYERMDTSAGMGQTSKGSEVETIVLR
ncbi:MAG: hypothetical protein JWO56_2284 [Acidobacteria bacterium]|nr:hypothetical protein [Acidobacteriota bacterium]